MKNSAYHSIRLFFCLIWYCGIFYAQNRHKADSLLHVLENNEVSTEKRATLLRWVSAYHPNLVFALDKAKESLEIATKIDNKILQAEAYEEISNIERILGNNGSSIEASYKAMKIYESLNDQNRLGASYNQIASNYVTDQDFGDAIVYFKKALQIYEKSNQDLNKLSTILNLGEAYRLFGNLDSAKVNFQHTLKLNASFNNNLIEGYALGNLGMVERSENNLFEAKKLLDTSIAILRPLHDYYSISTYLIELGKIHQVNTNYIGAEEKYIEALNISKQHGLKEQIKDVSTLLANLYQEQSEFKKALTYQVLAQKYQDSLLNKENIKKIEQIKYGYEIDKRESEIGLLNTINTNQKHLVILLATCLLLLVVFSCILYKGLKKIRKTNTLLSTQKLLIAKREKEKTLLLKELNHRVKNNLQMISSLLNLHSQQIGEPVAKEAIIEDRYRIEALSLVHRKLYQKGTETQIHIKEYIEELVLGVFHGYNAHFTPKFEIDDISIDIDTAIPLALIINELITNSLKYAFTGITNPKLHVLIRRNHLGSLKIQVSDNGVGFKHQKNQEMDSFGIRLIKSLTQQLEGHIQKLNQQGTFWNIDIKEATHHYS